MKKWYLPLLGAFCLLALTGVSCASSKTADGGFFTSFDQGESWEQRVFVRMEGKKVIQIDEVNIDSIVVDPNDLNILYATTRENGIFRSTDQGKQWTQTGLTGGRVRSMSIDPDNTNIIYATLNSTVLKSVDSGAVWTEALKDAEGAQITEVLVDSYDPKILWATTATGTVYKTTDGGNNWQVNNRFNNGIRWLKTSEDDTRVLYAAVAGEGLYKTTNKGRSWDQLQSLLDMGQTEEVYHLIVNPLDKDIVYVFTHQGLLYSVNGGKTWKEIVTLLGSRASQNDAVSAFVVDHPNFMLFTVNNTLHKSTDGGKTWKTVTGFPSARLIQVLTLDPEKNTTIYAGVRVVEKEGGFFPMP